MRLNASEASKFWELRRRHATIDDGATTPSQPVLKYRRKFHVVLLLMLLLLLSITFAATFNAGYSIVVIGTLLLVAAASFTIVGPVLEFLWCVWSTSNIDDSPLQKQVYLTRWDQKLRRYFWNGDRKRYFSKTALGFTIVVLLLTYIIISLGKSQGYIPPEIPIHVLNDPNPDQSLLTVFLIDGLRADIFEDELTAGNLPAIQALATNGCRVRSVMSSFPSITGYAYWPLLTGMDATRSGHLGTRTFDRRLTAGNWRNHYGPGSVHFEPTFEPNVPTLFEVTAAHRKGWTLSGNSMLKRGANVTYVAGLEQYFSKLMHAWWLAKLLRMIPVIGWRVAPNFYEFETRFVRRMLKLIDQGQPRVVWTVFPSTDNVAHALGVNEEYHLVLRAIDTAIGHYVDAVQSSNAHSYKSFTFAVISDHGEANVDIPAGGNLDLCEAFLSKGVRAWRGDAKAWSAKFDEPIETFGADKDLLIGIQGDASGSVYVKSSHGWLNRTYEDELQSYKVTGRDDVDLLQTALEYQGVELVAWSRENGVVIVQTKTSNTRGDIDISAAGVIHLESDGRISYTVEERSYAGTSNSRCPLGYEPNLADGKPRSAREWLKSTQQTPFPYAIVRLIQCLTVPGLAPDMVVTAQDGFDFGKDWEYFIRNFAGGHGGISSAHLRTPAIFSGKGVVATGDVVEFATAEDVGASLHTLLLGPLDSDDALPSLQFMEYRKDDDDIIAAAYRANANTTGGESYAQDLLRGTPISCITGHG